MFPCLVGIERGHISVDLVGVHFSLTRGQGYDLMTGGFHSARLMDVYVARIYRNHSIISACHQIYDSGVCLSPANKENHVTLAGFKSAGFENRGFGLGCISVVPITGGLLHIGKRQPLKNLGMASAHIVTIEMQHINESVRMALRFA